MKDIEEIEQYFNKNFLDQLARDEKIYYSPTCGIDKISSQKIYQRRDDVLEFICQKVMNDTYKFAPYKVKLITKGPNKLPRMTCIPTIRDKIVIATIKKYLYDKYSNVTFNISANEIVRKTIEIKKESEFDYFIKIDITNFFGSIDQDLLLEILNKKITNYKILNLIKKILINPTKYNDNDEKENHFIGIPQGLSISALLANIYLHDLDEKYKDNKKFKFFRYVDDILIFCKKEDEEEIRMKLISELKVKYSLKVNDDKFICGNISEEFEFLGYKFIDNKISIRTSSKIKFENSLECIFKNFSRRRDKNEVEINKFIWILNTKITGIVSENKRYGWLYYYSCITDTSILRELDNLVFKFIKRFKLEKIIDIQRIKKFKRSYYEMKKNYRMSTYLFKHNNVGLDEMIEFLETICNITVDKTGINEEELERKYRYNFYRTIKSLEKDLDDISN